MNKMTALDIRCGKGPDFVCISERWKEKAPMNERKAEIIQKIKNYDIIKDPQWLDRPDELVPLWVMLDALLQVIERFDPPNRPYD
jgi:acetone carboxylase gamma subunit